MNTPVHFRQALLEALTADLPSVAPAPVRPRRRVLLGVGAAAAAGVIAAAAGFGPDQRFSMSTAAWAVSSPDGDLVDIEVRYVEDNDLPGLEQALRTAGVPAVVRLARPGCVRFGDTDGSGAAKRVFVAGAPDSNRMWLQVRRSAMPSGSAVGIMVDRDYPGAREVVEFALLTTDNPGCRADRAVLQRPSAKPS